MISITAIQIIVLTGLFKDYSPLGIWEVIYVAVSDNSFNSLMMFLLFSGYVSIILNLSFLKYEKNIRINQHLKETDYTSILFVKFVFGTLIQEK